MSARRIPVVVYLVAVVAISALSPACRNDPPIAPGSGSAGHGGAAGTATGGAAGDGSAGNVGTAGTGSGGQGNLGGTAVTTGCGGTSGTAGTSGSGGTTAADPRLVACPPSPPTGCCSTEILSCAYPTKSCVCDKGTWSCLDCPATQPQGSDPQPIPTDIRLAFECRYGDVTCSWPTNSLKQYDSSVWRCGVCPTDRPTTGAVCGNTGFECRYGGDSCQCDAKSGTWQCATPTCDTQPNYLGSGACVTPGHFTCQYTDLGQSCVCGALTNVRRCTCPVALPTDGTVCLAVTDIGGKRSDCTYGDVTCTCDIKWHCATPTPICPTPQPTAGSACSTQVSCSYPTAICACDGATWSCQ
jgi:hypothetical protein